MLHYDFRRKHHDRINATQKINSFDIFTDSSKNQFDFEKIENYFSVRLLYNDYVNKANIYSSLKMRVC